MPGFPPPSKRAQDAVKAGTSRPFVGKAATGNAAVVAAGTAVNSVGKEKPAPGGVASPGSGKKAKPAEPLDPQEGAGGPLTGFRLSVITRQPGGKPSVSDDDFIDFELAPAMRSFADKQGQSVPGAGAGVVHIVGTNQAILNIPGARPVVQPMGLGEEYLELVGAFIGFDNPYDTPDNHLMKKEAAMVGAKNLIEHYRRGRELQLTLGVGAMHLTFDGKNQYRGRIVGKPEVTYRHMNRAYYRFKFLITNREDLADGEYRSEGLALAVAASIAPPSALALTVANNKALPPSGDVQTIDKLDGTISAYTTDFNHYTSTIPVSSRPSAEAAVKKAEEVRQGKMLTPVDRAILVSELANLSVDATSRGRNLRDPSLMKAGEYLKAQATVVGSYGSPSKARTQPTADPPKKVEFKLQTSTDVINSVFPSVVDPGTRGQRP